MREGMGWVFGYLIPGLLNPFSGCGYSWLNVGYVRRKVGGLGRQDAQMST